MWIAFVLWNSDICHSIYNLTPPRAIVVNCFCSLKFRYLSQPCYASASAHLVVNCFCSLKFRYLSQRNRKCHIMRLCCELLLFFEIQIFVTAVVPTSFYYILLWIAFVLWNSDICHSNISIFHNADIVVNCFCSLKFRYLSQHSTLCAFFHPCCELLLFFEIQIFVTACRYLDCMVLQLWIAFVLWNSDICHSVILLKLSVEYVVNCFCSLKFRYLSQPFVRSSLSNAVVNCFCSLKFRYLSQQLVLVASGEPVVNCFCSLKFRYLSQLLCLSLTNCLRCELLLFFEIQIFVTALSRGNVDALSCELLLFFEIQIFVTAYHASSTWIPIIYNTVQDCIIRLMTNKKDRTRRSFLFLTS